jgi:hypothetical protein
MGPLTTRCAIGAQQCRRPSTQITATTKRGIYYLGFILNSASPAFGKIGPRHGASRRHFAVTGVDRFV